MAFRTLEISQPSELHVKQGQLTVSYEDGTVNIPLEDLSHITCIGPDIRISTMALTQLATHGVGLVTLDKDYHPAASLTPCATNSRQSEAMHQQVALSAKHTAKLWRAIIAQKVANQARALAILGRPGTEEVTKIAGDLSTEAGSLTLEEITLIEAHAAKTYFSYLSHSLNRRSIDPLNSRLNYGYAIVRSAISRAVLATGLHPTFGLNHNNQFNAFNLVDDLIEPWRAMVDVTAVTMEGTSIRLTHPERAQLAQVLHNGCILDGSKQTTLTAIQLSAESLKRIIVEQSDEALLLPTILPPEPYGGVRS